MVNNIYLINFINFLRSKKYRIGFVIDGYPLFYNKIMASTRIRVYDVIKMFFDDKDFLVELYNPLRKYDIVIFQKKFDKVALFRARKLKSKGTKTVLDINVNYYDLSSKFISFEQNQNVVEFTKIVDTVIVPTEFLQNFIKKLFPNKKIDVIEESIDQRYFKKSKKSFHKVLNLAWSGYSVKAAELLLIEDVLKELRKEFQFNLLLICEKNPDLKIKGINISFEKYNYEQIADQLLKGDIFLAPRSLNDSYNFAHTFTKIGTGMAVGLPVLASPIPSYRRSPAILCKNKQEWKYSFIKLFTNSFLLYTLSQRGREYVKKYYSVNAIKSKYTKLFQELI